jgi:hypothetical protein
MAAISSSRLINIFCRTERATVWCERASTIVCENGHEVARNFPQGEFWQYCCDCNRFTPFDVLEGDEDYTQCRYCDERPLTRWFLCSECRILTVESDNLAKSKSFAIKEGKPSPSCPGCSTSDWNCSLVKHECRSLGVTYLTPRLHCLFCDERLNDVLAPEPLAPPVESVDLSPARFSGLAFLEAFAESNRWPYWQMAIEWLKAHGPKTLSHWVTVVGIAVGIVGILVGLVGPVDAVTRWIPVWLNHSPRVEAIECDHVISQGQKVPLRARADDPDGGKLNFRWTASAGKIEGTGYQVYLLTDDIIPKAVSTDLTVEVFVTDEFGLTAFKQERISVLSRNVLNNPPSLTVPPRCNCSNQEVHVGDTVSLYALAESKEANDTLSYDWQSSSPALEIVKTNSTSGSTATVNTAGMGQLVSPVPVKVTLRVSDGHGGEVTGDLTIMILPRPTSSAPSTPSVTEVKPNHSPKLEFFTADNLTVEIDEPVKLWVFATDPDGDAPLYYDWKVSAGEIINKGDTAVFNTAGIDPGQKIIILTISDGHGGSTSQKLFVIVKEKAKKTAPPSPTASPDPLTKPPSLPVNSIESGSRRFPKYRCEEYS